MDRGSWFVVRGSWFAARVEQERQVVGVLAQHHKPPRMFMGLGVEGNSSDNVQRIVDKGQGDGVKKFAGLYPTDFGRLDRGWLDFHRGRSF